MGGIRGRRKFVRMKSRCEYLLPRLGPVGPDTAIPHLPSRTLALLATALWIGTTERGTGSLGGLVNFVKAVVVGSRLQCLLFIDRQLAVSITSQGGHILKVILTVHPTQNSSLFTKGEKWDRSRVSLYLSRRAHFLPSRTVFLGNKQCWMLRLTRWKSGGPLDLKGCIFQKVFHCPLDPVWKLHV